MSENLLTKATAGSGSDPAAGAWTTWAPMPSLAPAFSSEAAPHDPGAVSLRAAGNGNRHCFGAWCQRIPAQPGTAYRLRVVMRCEGIENLFLHVTPHVVWRRDAQT